MKSAQLDIDIVENAVYFRSIDTIALGDFHLGYVYTDQTIPEPNYHNIETSIERVFQSYDPETVVFNGDLVQDDASLEHYRDEIIRITQKMINMVSGDVVFVRGNHDDAIPSEITISLQEQFLKDGYLFTHGDKTPTASAETYVISHVHPLDDNGENCLLYHPSAYYGGRVFVLPCFDDRIGGNKYTSPYSDAPVINDGAPLNEYHVVYDS